MISMKKLTRDDQNRIIAGVCSGIAKYFDVDPTLVRVIAVILAFITGFIPAIIAYIVLIFIMPEEGKQDITDADTKKSKRNS